jgi:hypothetical protein
VRHAHPRGIGLLPTRLTRRFAVFYGGAEPHGLLSETNLASWRRCRMRRLVADAQPGFALRERHPLGESGSA